MNAMSHDKTVRLPHPFVVIQVAATVDGKISSGPNRNMWEDMEKAVPDPDGTWDEVGSHLRSLHKPRADMLGSNSLVKEGDALRPLPAFHGDKERLYRDYLPDEVVHQKGLEGWLVVVDSRCRVRSGYKGEAAHSRVLTGIHSTGADLPARPGRPKQQSRCLRQNGKVRVCPA